MKRRYVIQHPKKGIYIGQFKGRDYWSAYNYGKETVDTYFSSMKKANNFIQSHFGGCKEIISIQIPQMKGDISILSLALMSNITETLLAPYPTENQIPC